MESIESSKPRPAVAPTAGSRWRHVQRQTTYKVIGIAAGQGYYPAIEGWDFVVYVGDEDDKMYNRSVTSFVDGRFEEI